MNFFDSRLIRTNANQLRKNLPSRPPCDFLIGAAIGVDEYTTTISRSQYEFLVRTSKGLMGNFMTRVIFEEESENIKLTSSSEHAFALNSLLVFYTKILDEVGGLVDSGEAQGRNMPKLETFLKKFGEFIDRNDRYLRTPIEGYGGFLPEHPLVFAQYNRTKSQERIAEKVALHLALAACRDKRVQGIRGPPPTIKKDNFTPRALFEKARATDITAGRIIAYGNDDLKAIVDRVYGAALTSHFLLLNPDTGSPLNEAQIEAQRRILDDNDKIGVFEQKKATSYRAFHFDVCHSLFPNNIFEVQISTLPWFLRNEGDERTDHLRYEGELVKYVKSLPPEVLELRRMAKRNLDNFFQRATY